MAGNMDSWKPFLGSFGLEIDLEENHKEGKEESSESSKKAESLRRGSQIEAHQKNA